MRVVHVGFHLPREERSPDSLLESRPALTDLASTLARRGVRVAVVQPAHVDAVLRRDGVEYRFVAEHPALLRRGTPGSRPVRAPAARVLDAVVDLRPDVVHVHGLTLPAHSRRLRQRLPDVRLLAQDHADRPPRPWRRPRARRDARAWDAVAFTAREQAEPFLRAGTLHPDVVVHEVPEASTRFGSLPPLGARAEAGLGGDPCLLWLGHLDPNKDPLAVLEGMSLAAPELPDPQLWCCYRKSALLPQVRRRIASDPLLRDRVHLLGPRPPQQVERMLQVADALVQGSHREGSGFAVLEAMACGAVPVVTDIPSFRKMVGPVGLLWSPGDPASLRHALLRLHRLDRRERRHRVRNRFEQELSWPAIADRLHGIYCDLVRAAPAAPAAPAAR